MPKVKIMLSNSKKHLLFFGEQKFIDGLEDRKNSQFDALAIEDGADADAILATNSKKNWKFNAKNQVELA